MGLLNVMVSTEGHHPMEGFGRASAYPHVARTQTPATLSQHRDPLGLQLPLASPLSRPPQGLHLHSITFHSLSSCHFPPVALAPVASGLTVLVPAASCPIASAPVVTATVASNTVASFAPQFLQKSFGPRSHLGLHTCSASTLAQPSLLLHLCTA